MNKKGFGLIVGVIGSLGLAAIVGKSTKEKIASKNHAILIGKIHDAFSEEGKIEGTWLDNNTQDYVIDEDHAQIIYNGGVTLRKNGELEQYSLKIDAETFEIIFQEKIL